MKKWFPILCLLTAILLPGCGRSAQPDPKAHVYKATEIVLPTEDYAFTLDTVPTWNGQAFTVQASRVDHALGGTFVDNPRIYTFLPDGTGLTDITDTAGADGADGLVLANYTLDNGETLLTEVVDGRELYLTLRDEEGSVLFRREFGSLYHVTYEDIRSGMTQFNMLKALRAETDGVSRYLVLTTEGLCAFDSAGELLWTQNTQQNPTALMDTVYGLLYLFGNQNEQSLCPVDPVTGALSDPIELPPELTGQNTRFLTGEGYDLYASANTALLGVRFLFDEEGHASCVTETVVDWAMSELAPAELYNFCIIDPDTIAVLQLDAVNRFENTKLLLLTHIPPEEVVEKETLTLAMLDNDYYMPTLVTSFNKTSDTHRIVIKDYTIYEEERRKTFFDADMAAGSVPDMVYFSDLWNQSLAESYEKVGLFADLTPLMAADGTFHAEELLGYVTRPYQREGGAQYIFPMWPATTTMWGDKTVFDGPPTVAEVMDVVEAQASPAMLFGYEVRLFRYMLNGLFNELTDKEAGTCHFDDGTLARYMPDMLRWWENIEREVEEPLIREPGYINSLYQWVMEREELGEKFHPIGWPGDGETLYVDGALSSYLTITAVSEHKTVCLDFMEYYIRHYEHGSYYYREQVYEELAEYADKTILFTASGTRTVTDEQLNDDAYMAKIPGYSPENTRKRKLTQADAREYIAFLDDIDALLDSNSELYQIYSSEFNRGETRSPEEVAAAIQSRAAIYLAETAK